MVFGERGVQSLLFVFLILGVKFESLPLELVGLFGVEGGLEALLFWNENGKVEGVFAFSRDWSFLGDSKFEKLSPKSDGAGLESLGSAYTITNNNSDEKEYNIVISSNNHNEKVLSQIKVAIDDLYVYNLTDLERSNGGYILRTYKLKPGYTKNHIIKAWYKQDTDESLIKDIKFEYRIETL